MKTILKLICVLLLVCTSCKHNLYTAAMIENLEDIQVGNGIALHPKQPLLLISKPTNQISENGKALYRIFQLKYKEDRWCCEEEVLFSSQHTDYHPVFSPDGQWVYFNSDRPKPSSTEKSERINIWRVKHNGGRWGKAEYLDAINTQNHESYPTITNSGTLYFNSDRTGGKGSMDIYKSEFVNGVHTKPVPITSLNTPDSENDLTIHPKEDFIIFNRYLFDSKEIELFISHNKNGVWTEPIPLDGINKKGVWELTPTLSPDGFYFLYEKDEKIELLKMKKIL